MKPNISKNFNNKYEFLSFALVITQVSCTNGFSEIVHVESVFCKLFCERYIEAGPGMYLVKLHLVGSLKPQTRLCICTYIHRQPLLVALLFKAWGLRLLACWVCSFESRREHGCLSVESVVCCQVEVYASGWSLVQGSPTDCGVSECDLETSTLRKPKSTRGCRSMGKTHTHT